MRVIGGAWKGRRLFAPAGAEVRPTSDRVKEAVFSILGDVLEGATVLDLCCGAGGLGIEALSRGADRAVFVDRSARALAAVRANLERCGATGDRSTLVRADAVAWLERAAVPAGPWLVLADPPYSGTLAGELAGVLGRRADASGFVAAIIEHPARGPGLPPVECAAQTRRYGETAITVLRPGPAGGEERP